MNGNENQELERLFGGNPQIKATLEQACDTGRSGTAAATAEPVFRDKQSLLGYVVQQSKSLGTWIERIEEDKRAAYMWLSFLHTRGCVFGLFHIGLFRFPYVIKHLTFIRKVFGSLIGF